VSAVEKIIKALPEEYRLYVQGGSDPTVREIVERESKWPTEAVWGFWGLWKSPLCLAWRSACGREVACRSDAQTARREPKGR
jgi:hypothetical protein